MRSATLKWFPLSLLLLLGACATLPSGPSVMVYPGSSKTFDQFRYDDMKCREYALAYVGGASPNQNATQSGVASAVAGTAIGAAAGAIVGGERGAAVGAGSGLLFGSLAGIEASQGSSYYSQRQYDNAYVQCMYANGHLVPVSGRVYTRTREVYEETRPMSSPARVSPPPGLIIPPPPPGPPPPPPPGM